MQISSAGVQVGSSNYTWQQSLRFFILGITYATVYALLPVGVVLWHNYVNYSDPIDWGLVWQMTLAAIGPAAYSYYREHKALLKAPPWFSIPDEFKPQMKQVTTMTQTVTPTEAGGKVIETEKETHVEPMTPKVDKPDA